MSATAVSKEAWSSLVLGGLATLIFGVAVVFWPGLTLTVLLYLFSTYILISGVVNIFTGLGLSGSSDTWFLPVVIGAFEAGVGVYLLRHIHVTFKTFVVLIGFTLIARGLVEAVALYYNSNAAMKLQVMGYLSGLAGLIVGIVILFSKPSSGIAFVWLLGVYALVVGVIHLAMISRD